MSSSRTGRRARVRLATGLLVAWLLAGRTGQAADVPRSPATPPAGLAFRVGKIVAMDDGEHVFNDAVLLVKFSEEPPDPTAVYQHPVRRGTIEALGSVEQITIPTDYRVFELSEYWLLPGIVEAHNHSTAGGWNDLNDMVYQTNPGLDTRGVPQPDCEWTKMARTGGITTALMLPGSGTNLAGMGTIVKTGGHNPDEITVRTPGSLKVAQAGNPEWYFGGNGRSFMNWNMRQTLAKARAYHERWTAWEQSGKKGAAPELDPAWEPFRGVFRGDLPVTNHTQIYQVELNTLDMFATRMQLWTVTEHSCFDAWKTGPLVCALEAQAATQANEADATPLHRRGARGGMWTIQGPRQFHFDTTARRMIGNAHGWWKNGVRNLSLNTDAPVIPQQELPYQATMACWYGWLPYPALHSITSMTSKSIGIYDRVGSLEPGKQADLSVWTGDPLDPRSACLLTVVNGRVVYDGREGVRRF